MEREHTMKRIEEVEGGNVTVDHEVIEGKRGRLLLGVDLDTVTGVSGSGKSMGIASTKGNIPVNIPGVGKCYVSLNIYRDFTKTEVVDPEVKAKIVANVTGKALKRAGL